MEPVLSGQPLLHGHPAIPRRWSLNTGSTFSKEFCILHPLWFLISWIIVTAVTAHRLTKEDGYIDWTHHTWSYIRRRWNALSSRVRNDSCLRLFIHGSLIPKCSFGLIFMFENSILKILKQEHEWSSLWFLSEFFASCWQPERKSRWGLKGKLFISKVF